jgi:Acyl-CoA carboxylase epsilon subunit
VTAVDDRQTPVVTVIRGGPTAVELAVLTSVLLAASAGSGTAAATARARPSAWAHRARVRRPLPPPGPGSWRASILPS